MRENWKDPEFRERNAEATREMLEERWKDPEFRERHAEAVRENWKDPEFRERHAEAVIAGRKSYIDTQKGYREDLERETASTVEANLERALRYAGKKVRAGKIYIIEENSKHLKLKVDLIAESEKQKRGYMLMPHPQAKTRERVSKLEEQEKIKITIVTERVYHAFQNGVGRKISYWENGKKSE